MNKLEINLGTWAATFDDRNRIWFSCYEFNGLFVYDTVKETIQLVDFFDGNPLDMKESHGAAFFKYGKAVFTPLLSHRIHIVDINTYEERSIDLKGSGELLSRPLLFGDDIYIVYDNTINKLSIASEDYVEIKSYTEVCNDYFQGEKFIAFPYSGGFVFRGEINRNKCLRIDLGLEKIERFEISPPIFQSVFSIQYYMGEYWLIDERNRNIVSYNIDSDEYKIYYMEDDDGTGKECSLPYFFIKFSEVGKWVINYYAKTMYQIDEERGVISPVTFYSNNVSFTKSVGWGAATGCTLSTDDALYFLPQRGKQCFVFNKTDNSYSCRTFSVDLGEDKRYRELIRFKASHSKCIDEEEYGLDNFIKYLGEN